MSTHGNNILVHSFSPATYRIVESLSSIISANVIVPLAGTITHLYSLPFLLSSIAMFATTRLLLPKVVVYPASMPPRMPFILYGPVALFNSHAAP